MLWLKRILANWVVEGHASTEEKYADSDRKYPSPVLTGTGRGIAKKSVSSYYGDQCEGELFKNPMNITLYNAVGGRIVKFSRWDSSADTTQETTYVVTNDENFEEALGKFIAMEALKHVD